MLFVAAPGPHVAESEKVWALQTATAMEFENTALCQQAYGDIVKSVSNTDTVTVRAWCFPKNMPPPAVATESKTTPESKIAPESKARPESKANTESQTKLPRSIQLPLPTKR
jgi:hypothetical protein